MVSKAVPTNQGVDLIEENTTWGMGVSKCTRRGSGLTDGCLQQGGVVGVLDRDERLSLTGARALLEEEENVAMY